MTDEEQLAQLLADLAAAEHVRATLPSGSRDRAMVEQTVVVLNLRIRHMLEPDRTRHVTPRQIQPDQSKSP